MSADLLTEDEQEVVRLLGRVYGLFSRIAGQGPSRQADMAEVVAHIHDLQHMAMAQAAARAYPETYRLMGDER